MKNESQKISIVLSSVGKKLSKYVIDIHRLMI